MNIKVIVRDTPEKPWAALSEPERTGIIRTAWQLCQFLARDLGLGLYQPEEYVECVIWETTVPPIDTATIGSHWVQMTFSVRLSIGKKKNRPQFTLFTPVNFNFSELCFFFDKKPYATVEKMATGIMETLSSKK